MTITLNIPVLSSFLKEMLLAASQNALSVSIAFSVVAFALTLQLIPALSDLFLKAGLFGKDLNKPDKPQIPETQGLVCGMVFLICLFLFIPIPFFDDFIDPQTLDHQMFAKFLSALLSICCMILLGFADDVLDLRWRHKLLLPTLATIPLLMVYLITNNRTEILLPKPLQALIGGESVIDLGILYYIYMGMLAVFCTNSINILAGINGVEAGQSFVIGLSIAANNVLQLYGTCCVEGHTFSLYIILPFLGVTAALLYHNWYPSRVFVGDTFCYFAGMTFAVVGILGHFSKTMLLFFIPQVFNFIFSAPQLFGLVECPRHRMPKFNPKTGLLEPSQTSLKNVGALGQLVIKLFSLVGLLEFRKDEGGNPTCNNFTLINLVLVKLGPMREDRATMVIMLIQGLFSLVAFLIRYPLISLLY